MNDKLTLKLTGNDGNAYAILGLAVKTLQLARVSQQEIDEFTKEATSGDYDHLLQTCIEYFKVE